MNQTLEQKRSKYAFEKIIYVKGKNFEKKLSSLIGKLATLILTNGLGNTLAFLFAKGKDEHLYTIYILSDWLINNSSIGKKDLNITEYSSDKVKKETQKILNNLVLNASVEEYIFYTEEALRLTNWLRRFADSLLEKGEENE